jgi:hypothetical protein
MGTEIITIQVDPQTARAYSKATEEERQKMQLLLRLRLQELTTRPARRLTEVMDEIGQKAEARGLTPTILESLLHDE